MTPGCSEECRDEEKMFEKSIIVCSHPDDEVLWFSSVLEHVDEIIICYTNIESNKEWTMGRRRSLSEYPLKNLSSLDLTECEGFFDVPWPKPVLTKYGIEITRNDSSERKYKKNYYKLRTFLKNKLSTYKNIITHNPWGEYGHAEHIQVYRVIRELQDKMKFNIWFSNYCSNMSSEIMYEYLYRIKYEFTPFETNELLAKDIMDMYKRNKCWTWYDDYKWSKEEIFLKDGMMNNHETQRFGQIIPLNFIRVQDFNESHLK